MNYWETATYTDIKRNIKIGDVIFFNTPYFGQNIVVSVENDRIYTTDKTGWYVQKYINSMGYLLYWLDS